MKKIKLTQGQVALVSDHRYEELNQWEWYAYWSEGAQTFYARRNDKRDGKRITITMHRQVMGAKPGDPDVDHINHNGLDNQDHNLRFVTPRQNQLNRRGLQSNNTTGEKNISLVRRGKMKGYYSIQVPGVDKVHQTWRKQLGDAIAVRDKWVREYQGAS